MTLAHRPSPLELVTMARARHRIEAAVPSALLAATISFGLYALRPEATVGAPLPNDGVIHLLNLERAANKLISGRESDISWLDPTGMGSPMSHYYQPLPYAATAAIYALLSQALRIPISLDASYGWVLYALLSAFPLSVFWFARRLGASNLAAALAAALTPLVVTDGLDGIEYSSYLWRGHGLFTQLWAMVLLPLAAGQAYLFVWLGRGLPMAALLAAATVYSDVGLGCLALGSAVLLSLLPILMAETLGEGLTQARRRLTRLALLLATVTLMATPVLAPHFENAGNLAYGVWESDSRYDSYGRDWVLSAFLGGALLDFGRIPILTVLALAGTLLSLFSWRREGRLAPAALALLWLALFFGRTTWGAAADLLPASAWIPMGRFVIGLQLAAVVLGGLALAAPWEAGMVRRGRWLSVAVVLATALVLIPAYQGRLTYLAENNSAIGVNKAAYSREASEMRALVATVKAGGPGRTYAGPAAGWGGKYRVGDVPVYALLTRAGLDTIGTTFPAMSLNPDTQRLFDETRRDHFEAFNVRYVVAPSDWSAPSFLEVSERFGRHVLYKAPASGYLQVAGSAMAFRGLGRDLYFGATDWLASRLPAALDYPTVQLDAIERNEKDSFPLTGARDVFAGTGPLLPTFANGEVLSEEWHPDEVSARVEMTAPGTLVFKVPYQEGWSAEADGAAAQVVRVLPNYVAVKLQPGLHLVRFRYQPPRPSAPLSAVGLLGLLAAILLGRSVGRSGQETCESGKWASLRKLVARVGHGTLPLEEDSAGTRAKHLPFVLCLVLLTLVAGLPLLQLRTMAGHDALEYLPRNQEFFHLLQSGYWFPRWAPDFGGGYGQPFFLFNPPVFYYVSSLFRFLGFGLGASGSLAALALLLIAGTGMYALASRFFGPHGGLAASVGYVFAPYVVVALYVRHAMSDFAAFAFVPLAFWGLAGSMESGRRVHFWAAALGTALVILSSNPVTLMAVPVLFGYVVWVSIGTRDKTRLLRGGAPLLLGLGLPAYFWIPALFERQYVQLWRLFEAPFKYSDHFVYPIQYLSSRWGYGFSGPGSEDDMSFALGVVWVAGAFAAVGTAIWVRGRRRVETLTIAFFATVLLSAAFLASQLSEPVWDALPLLHYLAYPWRFLSLAAVASGFLLGAPFLLVRGRVRGGLGRLVALGLLLVVVIPGLPDARPAKFKDYRDADYAPAMIAEKRIYVTAADEYEPAWVQEKPPGFVPDKLVLYGNGSVISRRVQPERQEFIVGVDEPSRARLNTSFFPGWTLYVDGVEVQPDYGNPQGLLEFNVGKGSHEIVLAFGDTPLRFLARALTLACLAGVAIRLVLALRSGPRLRRRAGQPATMETT